MSQIHKLLELDKNKIESAGVLDIFSEKEDVNIYINAESLLYLSETEFLNAKEVIENDFFDKLLKATILLAGHGKDSMEYNNFLKEEMRWSELKNGKGYFGMGKDRKDGKGAGLGRRHNMVVAMQTVMINIYKSLLNDRDTKAARLYNFYPNAVVNLGTDVMSDILLIIFRDSFIAFTKRKIIELGVKKKYISRNGLIMLNGKEEYFYPEPIFTQMPIVDTKSYNAIKKINSIGSGSIARLDKLFNNKKNLSLEMLDINDSDHIFDMLDYKFLVSIFLRDGEKYSDYKKEIIKGRAAIKGIVEESGENLNDFLDRIIEAGDEIYNLGDKYGDGTFLEIHKESLVQKWIYAGLTLKYMGGVSQHNYHNGNGIDDIKVVKNGEKSLIELKYLNSYSKASEVIKKYKTQLEQYSIGEVYKDIYYIVYANNFSKDELIKLVNGLNEVEHDKMNAKFKVVAVERFKTASIAEKFTVAVRVIEDVESIHKLRLDMPEVFKIIKAKKEYKSIYGKNINSVDLTQVRESVINGKLILKTSRKKMLLLKAKLGFDEELSQLTTIKNVNTKIKEYEKIVKNMKEVDNGNKKIN